MRRIVVIVVIAGSSRCAPPWPSCSSRPTTPRRPPPRRSTPCAAGRRRSPTPGCWPRRSTVSGSPCWPARRAATPSGNVVISPLSIGDVLSMILNGAQGRTATEMRHTLGLEGLSLPETDQAWADLIAAAQAGRRPAVQIADSLWLRSGVAFAPQFLTAGRDYFAAATLPLPTDPTKAADAVNGWVDARTAGLIKQIVQPGDFSDATILAVVNTVHVKAAWAGTRSTPARRPRGRSRWPTAPSCGCRP